MGRPRRFRIARRTARESGPACGGGGAGAPPRLRGILLQCAFLLFFAAVIAQIVRLQNQLGPRLEGLAHRQYDRKILLAPQRGAILDRGGRTLAASVMRESVFVDPRFVEGPEATAAALSAVLGVDEGLILARLGKEGRAFEWVKRTVSPEEAVAVSRAGLSGVHTVPEAKRTYPHGPLLSHVMGFAGTDGVGLEGLEKVFDRYLSGSRGWYRMQRDAKGREIRIGRGDYVPSVPGLSLRLTVDWGIQTMAERLLAAQCEAAGAIGGTIVVMDAQGSEVLALACWPTYDPNDFLSYPPQVRRNRALTDPFEPGSTFKPFVMAAALDEGSVRLTDKVFCENGWYRVGGRTIHDYHAHGWLTAEECLIESSNIALSKIGVKLGREALGSYLAGLGFGSPTQSGMPGDGAGIVRPCGTWRPIELANISFGQGVAVTALQLAAGYCALASDGCWRAPSIVRSVEDSTGAVIWSPQRPAPRRVYTEATAREIRRVMGLVVEEGTGRSARVAGLPVGGKTGTAQKVDPDGSYSQTRFVASFVGFAPVERPDLVILVSVDEPCRAMHFGSQAAAPVFRELMCESLAYLGLHVADSEAVVDADEGEPSEPLARAAAASPVLLREDGALCTASVTEIRPGYVAVSGDGHPWECAASLPDVSGLTIREALAALSPLGVSVSVRGSGVVLAQEPPAGTSVAPGAEVEITCTRPAHALTASVAAAGEAAAGSPD